MVLLSKTGLVILRLNQVQQRVGLKRSSIYQKISEGTFPTQVQLGVRSVGWIESEINAWIVSQVEKCRTVPVVMPMTAEATTGSAVIKQTGRNRVRTKQQGRPPKFGSYSSFPGADSVLSPPFASVSKGGHGDE